MFDMILSAISDTRFPLTLDMLLSAVRYKALDWLPISDRVTYKLSCMCYNSVTTSTPQYLADLLQIYTPSRTLRSTADTRKLKIPLFKRKYSGQGSFSYQGPVTWNNLPFSIRHTQTYSSIKSQLKTHLFSQTFQ